MRSTPAARPPTRHPAWPLTALGVLLAGAALLAPRAEAATGSAGSTAEETTDRLIVHYRDGTSGGGRRSALQAAPHATALALQRLQTAGLQTLAVHRNGLGAQVLHLNRAAPVRELDALARQLMADDPNVLYAEPDRRLQALSTPTDPLYASQWHYFEATGGLNLPLAWDRATGSGIVVGVVDTGVLAHADLADNLLPGHDFISSTSSSNDGDGRDADATDPGDGCNGGQSSWHGTHVAGTVAAVANNGEGGAGVAYGAKILPVRVLGCGGGYFSDIADGVLWASGNAVGGVAAPSQPARVLNLSLGGRAACPTTMQAAINQARANGAVVVVAAGNSNQDASLHTPANCAGVVTVAANGRGGGRAPYSNYGARIDVTAPGGNQAAGAANGVLSTLNDGYSTAGNDSYAYYQGTSMAAPHVAGVAALMLSRNPALTPDEVEVLLKSTARPLPVACTLGCGRGIVHAAAAVNAVFLGAGSPSTATETEPNDAFTAAQVLSSFPVKLRGTMATATDIDTVKVNVGVGQTVTARLIGADTANYDLFLRNLSGTLAKSSLRGAGLTDTVSWRNAGGTAVDIYLRVRRVSGPVGAAGTYTLEVNR
ncbi:S8 family peptidase [Ideonella sp.]|uniref:S8 family peptidase n=1 Tax=Ideonella sp. TaxID=1929293 RepID=UPI002B492C02|nr:S8 family peptidase [Ideonella sp.]HJV69466.1 S8 family peptidase [Ideonella sp.]